MAETGFVHLALVFSSTEELLTALEPRIDASIRAEEAVYAFLDQERWQQLSAALPLSMLRRMTHVAAGERYATPAGAVRCLHETLRIERRRGTGRVLSIGEIPFGGASSDAEWLRYEAATNEVFADAAVTGLCLYDTDRVPASVLRTVPCTHPHPTPAPLGSDGLARLRRFADSLEVPPVAPPRPPDRTLRNVSDVRMARREARSWALHRGVDTATAAELELLVDELVVNAGLHGGGDPEVALWSEPDGVVLSVTDDGPGIDDPFAGLRPPDLVHQGAGLWMAAVMGERFVARTGPRGGAEVSVRLRTVAR